MVKKSSQTSSLTLAFRGVERRVAAVLIIFALFGTGLLGPAQAYAQETARLEDARQWMSQKKWDQAAVILRSLNRLSPDSLAVVEDLSKTLTYLGRREEALTLLWQFERKARAQGRLAPAHAASERAKVVARLFLTHGTQQTFQDGLALTFGRKFKLAKERFEKAIEQEPDQIDVLVRLGQCQVLEGETAQAIERLRFARRLLPNEPIVALWLGRAFQKKGDLKQAKPELEWAYAKLTGSEQAVVWWAEALIEEGKKAEALKVLERDTKANPLHLESLATLGRAQFDLYLQSKVNKAPEAQNSRDTQSLWEIRKTLQLVMSRLPQLSEQTPILTSPGQVGLGLDLKNPKTIEADTQALLEKVQEQIEL